MVKLMVFWILFTIAVYYDFDIDQIDMKIAFLYSLIDQLVYMQISNSLEISANKNIICKLLKVLYGLKSAPRL